MQDKSGGHALNKQTNIQGQKFSQIEVVESGQMIKLESIRIAPPSSVGLSIVSLQISSSFSWPFKLSKKSIICASADFQGQRASFFTNYLRKSLSLS